MKPNHQRAKVARLFLYLSMAASLLFAASNFQQYLLINSFLNGASVDMARAQLSDFIQYAAAAIWLLVYIGTVITFIMWFRRGYYNLHKVPGIRPQFAEGWAAGGWFVPFLNLGRPYTIMKEMMADSQFSLEKSGIIERSKDRVSLVGWWWALFLTSNIIGNAISRMSTETAEQIANHALYSCLIEVFTLVPLFLAIRMLNTYHKLEVLLPEIGIKAAELSESDLLDS